MAGLGTPIAVVGRHGGYLSPLGFMFTLTLRVTPAVVTLGLGGVRVLGKVAGGRVGRVVVVVRLVFLVVTLVARRTVSQKTDRTGSWNNAIRYVSSGWTMDVRETLKPSVATFNNPSGSSLLHNSYIFRANFCAKIDCYYTNKTVLLIFPVKVF